MRAENTETELFSVFSVAFFPWLRRAQADIPGSQSVPSGLGLPAEPKLVVLRRGAGLTESAAGETPAPQGGSGHSSGFE